VYKQILINAELQIGKRGQRMELTERGPLRRRRSALDCSAIEGEGEPGGGGGRGEEEEEKKSEELVCFVKSVLLAKKFHLLFI
jgi:hypothetical protein